MGNNDILFKIKFDTSDSNLFRNKIESEFKAAKEYFNKNFKITQEFDKEYDRIARNFGKLTFSFIDDKKLKKEFAKVYQLEALIDEIGYLQQKILDKYGDAPSIYGELDVLRGNALLFLEDLVNGLENYESIGIRDISTLGSLGELEEAIGYYSERLQTATKEELGGIGKTIIALEKKRKALEQIVELPRMEGEIGELRGLTGKKLRVELELIGLEGIRGKIRDLEKMLGDVEKMLGDDERKRVEELVKEWKGYELQLQKSQLTLKGAWDGVKGMGEGITGLTETLEGNGSVWEKIVGVIDGALGLYESIEGVIGIVKLLTQTTEAQAVAEGVKATAVATGAATEASATATELGTSAATTAAVGIEAGAWSALAAAKTFAAHASIPFAGTPIAAGFVETQQGLIAMAAIPKFADGGIAYGPTLGIFGEYAGARSNPEVVAPLDRLRSLVGGDGEPTGGGKVVFKIDGRTLVGVLEKTERFNKRTK